MERWRGKENKEGMKDYPQGWRGGVRKGKKGGRARKGTTRREGIREAKGLNKPRD